MPNLIEPHLPVPNLLVPNLLVIDASSSLCSVALFSQGQSWHKVEEQPRRQAQLLLPMIDELLGSAGVVKQQLNGIAYGRGPGSFTGIRIAASVAQGLSLALNLPVLGLSSLQAVAQETLAHTDANSVMVIMNAHMGEVFWGQYVRQGELSALQGTEQVGSAQQCLAQLAEFNGVVAGNALTMPEFAQLDKQFATIEPQAQFLLPLALEGWQQQLFSEPQQHLPVYLRDSVAWKKLDEQPSLLNRP